jgi:hypothetical protein
MSKGLLLAAITAEQQLANAPFEIGQATARGESFYIGLIIKKLI